jgi:hypothetical protein
LKIRTWITSTVEIIKVGLPGASMGVFNVILIYVINLILSASLGILGLDIFNVCMNSLLIISIFIVGFSEALSSVVPVFYSQNDFYNVQYIVRKSLLLSLVFSIAFTIFILVYPDGILMFFNLAKVHNDALVENALRIYSLAFIPMAISTTLIFYYEGIERPVESGIIALISELLGPLGFTFALYPLIGVTSVWISFPLGFALSIVLVAIYVKLVERKETEYSGLFFVKRGLIEKSRNYTLKSKDDDVKTEIRELYLKVNKLGTLKGYENYPDVLNMKGNKIFSKYFKHKIKRSSAFIKELSKKLDNKYSAEDLKNIFKAEKDLIIELGNKKYADIQTPNIFYSIIRANDTFAALRLSPQIDFIKSIK